MDPAGRTRWGQAVREPNNMFIVYFSGPVKVYPAGRTSGGRWSENRTTFLLCILVVIQSQCTLPALQGRGRWSEKLTTCLLCISVVIQSQCTLPALQGGGRWSDGHLVVLMSMPGVWVT